MSFELKDACECARLAQISYMDVEEATACIHEEFPKYTTIKFIDHDGCQMICLSDVESNQTRLVFRGSEFDTQNDIMANLNIVRGTDTTLSQNTHNVDIHVHGGFLEEIESIWPSIYKYIEDVCKSKYHHILLTGHSLGGALALLCGTRLAACFDLLWFDCYSFGAPMVGGTSFEACFESLYNVDHIRIVNNNDVVPRLKTLSALGYCHVGELVYLSTNHEIIHHALTWEERAYEWFWGHWKAITHFKWLDSFQDHKMIHYATILNEHMDTKTCEPNP